jgi:hypothetical protein
VDKKTTVVHFTLFSFYKKYEYTHTSIPRSLWVFVRVRADETDGLKELRPPIPSGFPPASGEMSFFFRAATRQRPSPQEIARSIKDSLVALDTKTGAKVYAQPSSILLPHSHPLHGPPIRPCRLAASVSSTPNQVILGAVNEVELLCLWTCSESPGSVAFF